MKGMSSFDTTKATLLLRLREKSDTLSWHEFHARYGELLYKYARSRGASAVDAEDIVQDVELAVFKAMDGFVYDVSKGRFRSYLRAAVLHAMGRRASKQARQGEHLDPNVFDYIAGQRDTESDDRWEREWQLHRLRWALRAIAKDVEPNTLKAFQMHVVEGVPAGETATRLDISRDSVYQAKSRICRRIKERLDSVDPDGDL